MYDGMVEAVGMRLDAVVADRKASAGDDCESSAKRTAVFIMLDSIDVDSVGRYFGESTGENDKKCMNEDEMTFARSII